MQPVDSTAEILFLRMLYRSVDKQWADWAYEMLVAGFDSESLVMLAGEMNFYNQFEMQRLADKALDELNLNWDDRENVLRDYARYLVKKAVSGKTSTATALDTLAIIYRTLDYEEPWGDFYALYYAKSDLDLYGFQHYWDGATKENIDEIIISYFREWLSKNEV